MNKKLFYFSTWISDAFEIKSCEVVKETKSQYVAQVYGTSTKTINKSSMQTLVLRFFETKEQAIEGRRVFIEECIAKRKKTIEICQNEVEKLENLLTKEGVANE